MERKRRKFSPRSNNNRALALALIGAGLVLIGALAVFMLPRLDAGSGSEALASGGERSAIPVPVNFPAPDLELTDLDGESVALADFSGDVVLVNNWATWCPPCKEEMPTFEEYYRAHSSQGFIIIAVEAGEPPSEVRSFVEQYGLTFPVWPDRAQKSLRTFRNMSLPNSYVIDRTGTVRFTWTGAVSMQVLEQYVTPLLEE